MHCPEDGDRLGQDRRHGDAHRVADPQQDREPEQPAVRQALPGHHARHHHPRPPPRAPAQRPAELLPPPRRVPSDLEGPARQGADHHHELPPPSSSKTPRIKASRARPARSSWPARARPVRETEAAMVSRSSAASVGQAVWRDRRPQRRGPPLLHGQADHRRGQRGGRRDWRRDDKARNEDARVWFRASAPSRSTSASRRSMTSRPRPSTSAAGWEGYIFPWTVSDFCCSWTPSSPALSRFPHPGR